MSGKKRKATIINNNNKKQKLSESGQSAIQSPYDTTTTITTASNETNSRNNLNDQDAISEDFENERQEQNLESLDIFGKARYALQLSTIPSKLPGREKQKEEIEFVVRESILNGKSRAMMLCGVPGTGKTAVVLDIIRNLRQDKKLKNKFIFYPVNVLNMQSPSKVFSKLYFDMTGILRTNPQSALDGIQKTLQNQRSKRKPFLASVVLLDELDVLLAHKDTAIYHLFDLPKKFSHLFLIGISNTLDFATKIQASIQKKGLSRIDQTMSFVQYNGDELKEILKSRISDLNLFDPEAISIVAKKAASLNGDVRRMLDIARMALTVGEQQWNSEIMNNNHDDATNSSLNTNSQQPKITVQNVQNAIHQLQASGRNQAVEALSLHQQITLLAISIQSDSTGTLDDFRFEDIYERYETLCKRLNEDELPCSEIYFLQLLSTLEEQKLILLTNSSAQNVMSQLLISLNLNVSDIFITLKENASITSIVP